jgi:hypothetical protein
MAALEAMTQVQLTILKLLSRKSASITATQSDKNKTILVYKLTAILILNMDYYHQI